MSLEHEMAELSTLYHGSREYIEDLERAMKDSMKKIVALEQIIDGLIELTPACTAKTRLLKKYQALKQPKGAGDE